MNNMERVEGLFFDIKQEGGIASYPVFEINEMYHYIKNGVPIMIDEDSEIGEFVIKIECMPLDHNDPKLRNEFSAWLEAKRPKIGTHFNTIEDNKCSVGLDNDCPNMPVEDVGLLFKQLINATV